MIGNAENMQIELKFNIVSIANFFTLIGVLVTAISSYYAFVNKVDETQKSIKEITMKVAESIIERKAEIAALKEKDDIFAKQISDIQLQTTSRLVGIEVELRAMGSNMQRIDTFIQQYFDKRPQLSSKPIR